MKKLATLIILLSASALADTGFKDTIRVTDTDGNPSCMAGQLKFGDGQVSCSGQTATITITGGGGGGSSSLEVMRNGVRVSSPTATLKLIAGSGISLTSALAGAATAAITINVVSTAAYQSQPNTFTSSQTITDAGGLRITGPILASSGTLGSAGNAVFISSNLVSGATIYSDGRIVGLNLNGSVTGTNTGDQTITLTGDVTGSGTGSFAATAAALQANIKAFSSPITVTGSSLSVTGPFGIKNTYGLQTGTLTLTGLTSQSCVGTDGSGNVQAGTCGGGGGASVDPATTTFRLNKGVSASTITLTNITDAQVLFSSSTNIVGNSSFTYQFNPVPTDGIRTLDKTLLLQGNQAFGAFPDPDLLHLKGDSKACIGMEVYGDTLNLPIGICRSGTGAAQELAIGAKSVTGGMLNSMTFLPNATVPYVDIPSLSINSVGAPGALGQIKAEYLLATSSVAVPGPGGIRATYGLVAGTMTVTNLAVGECVQTTTGGLLTTTGAPCGSGGGGGSSSLEVMEDGLRVSSPTASINLISGTNVTITGALAGSATSAITINATGDAVLASTQTFAGRNTFTNSVGVRIVPASGSGANTQTSGALQVDCTSARDGICSQIYRNDPVTPSQASALMFLMQDATSYNTNMLWIKSNSTSTNGGNADINIHANNPDIEFRELDRYTGTNGNGQWEIDVNNDELRVNKRNAANTSFETLVAFNRDNSMKFKERDGNGDYIAIRATNTLSTSYSYNLPPNAPSTVGDVIRYAGTTDSDGFYNTEWATPSAGSGDITDVIAGFGLTGGAASGAATLSAGTTTAFQTQANTFTQPQTVQSSVTVNGETRTQSLVVSGSGPGVLDLTQGTTTFGVSNVSRVYASSTTNTVQVSNSSGTFGDVLISTIAASQGQCAVGTSTRGQVVWAPCGTGGSGTPGGSTKQVQYNNGGSFAGTDLIQIHASSVTAKSSWSFTNDGTMNSIGGYGYVDVFYNGAYSGQNLFCVGSQSQHNQFCIANAQPINMGVYGAQIGLMKVGYSGTERRIESTGRQNYVDIDTGGNMTLNTDNDLGTGVISLRPQNSEKLKITAADGVYVDSSVFSVNGVKMIWPSSGTVGNYLRYISSSTLSWDAAGGGTSISVMYSTRSFVFACPSLNKLETNFAVNTSTNTGTSNYLTCSFDNTTRQYVNGTLVIPPNLASSGVINIRTGGRSSTAAASKNVGWILEHQPLANGESNATAYLTSMSGALAVDATQGDKDVLSWSMSVSSSTWAANDVVNFRFSRDVNVTNNLASPYYNDVITVDIPITAVP